MLDPDAVPISDQERAALEAIISAPAAWAWTRPPRAKAAREFWLADCRLDLVPARGAEAWLAGLGKATSAAIPGLVELGLVDAWGLPDGSKAATLSSLAAATLGFELSLVGRREILPRWLRAKDLPRFLRSAGERGMIPMPFPELVVAKGPTVPELVMNEYTGEPVKLLGMEIYRDRRIPAAKPGPKRDKVPRGKRARAG